MKKTITNTLIFFIGVLLLAITFNIITATQYTTIYVTDKNIDLTAYDLSKETVLLKGLNREIFDFYPEQLYTPEDFHSGRTIDAAVFVPARSQEINYGTYHIIIRLPANQTYGLTTHTIDYAQTTYINGVLQQPVGRTGTSADAVTPDTEEITFYFTPETDTTEMIIQYSNFNHRDGGGLYDMRVSSARNVDLAVRKDNVKTVFFSGCIFMMFIFYIGMFLFFTTNRAFLYFALCCLAIGLRTIRSLFSLLLPELSWYIVMDIEYLGIPLTFIFFAAFLNKLYPNLYHRYVLRFLYAVSSIFCLIVVFLRPVVYSGLLNYYFFLAAPCGLYIVVMLIFSLKQRRLENTLTFIGVLVFFICAVNDMFYYHNQRLIGRLTEPGMLVFLFANMMALTIGFHRTEESLSALKQSALELEEQNKLLDRLNHLRTEFLANISHEMKTPLTVVSSHTQLIEKKLTHGMTADDVRDSVAIITEESARMGNMVDELLEVSKSLEQQTQLGIIDLNALINNAALSLKLQLEQANNQLQLELAAELPPARADYDKIKQVIFNLLSNANRHTQDGVITICTNCSPSQKHLTVTVSDTGTGIEQEHLDNIFKRFYKAAPTSVTGLGLAVCKQIIESHGGTIEITSSPGEGTTVTFTLRTNDKEDAYDE